MENKNSYFKALLEDNGHLNEIDLGAKIGLNEEETREIIVQLLSEHKIDYIENRTCNYSVAKTLKRKKRRK